MINDPFHPEEAIARERDSNKLKLLAVVCAVALTAILLVAYGYVRKYHEQRVIAENTPPPVPEKAPPLAHVVVDEPLGLEDRLATMDADRLGDEHEVVPRSDLAAEADILQAAESDEVDLVELDVMAIIARELRGRLADQYAGHEGIVGHVAADPELVGGDVLVADDQVFLGVDRHDRRQLLHLEALGVAPADGVLIGQDP